MSDSYNTHVPRRENLNVEEKIMLLSSRTVLVLAKTVEDMNTIIIYADNFFTSIKLFEHLKEKYGCIYVEIVYDNRIGNPSRISFSELNKKTSS